MSEIYIGSSYMYIIAHYILCGNAPTKLGELLELRSLTTETSSIRLLSHFGVHFKHARVVLPRNEIAF